MNLNTLMRQTLTIQITSGNGLKALNRLPFLDNCVWRISYMSN